MASGKGLLIGGIVSIVIYIIWFGLAGYVPSPMPLLLVGIGIILIIAGIIKSISSRSKSEKAKRDEIKELKDKVKKLEEEKKDN